MLCKQWAPQHAVQMLAIFMRSRSVCVYMHQAFIFHRSFTGCGNQGWVGAILPAPTPSPGPAQRMFLRQAAG